MPKRAKAKLTKIEKIERDIRLAYLKQERALKMIEKGKRDLMASAKALARGHASKRRLEAKAADELVKAASAASARPDFDVEKIAAAMADQGGRAAQAEA
jgi:hypothetical protein